MKRMILSAPFLLAGTFLIVEQLIVASSTLWLTQLGGNMMTGKSVVIPLVAFVGSLTLVYVPSIFKMRFLSVAKVRSLEIYVKQLSITLFSVPSLSRNKDFQTSKRGYMESEAFLVIDESLDFFFSSAGLLLNVLFNISVFAFAIKSSILYAYISAILIGLFFTTATNRYIADKSTKLQSARSGLFSCLTFAWDSITLGNAYNRDQWLNHFKKKADVYKSAASGSVTLLEFLTTLGLWCAIIPVLAMLGVSLVSPATPIAMKAVILATVPRHIQTIQYLADVINSLLKGSAVKQRLTNLWNAAQTSEEDENLKGRIDTTRISCHDEKGQMFPPSFDELPKTGRITIRGENGSGKTSLLLQMKSKFKHNSLVIPPHSNLFFDSLCEQNQSTGERMRMIINEVLSIDGVEAVFLDEWDANLDETNTSILDKQIDRLSQQCCVVEVRHKLRNA